MKIVVLGQGRFGKLWAHCLMPLGRVQAYDPIFLHNISPYPLLKNKKDLDQAILECDVLFFCIPISELKGLLEELQAVLKHREQAFCTGKISHKLWLMDTCSVKLQPMQCLQNAITYLSSGIRYSGIRYLGLHPMFGPDSMPFLPNSQQNSLQNKELRLVLCPPLDLNMEDIALWKQHFKKLGLCVIQMSAEAHDEEAARTQGLTHLLGRVLEAFGIRESPIATAGYEALCKLREQTCHDTWQLFLDLQQQNSYTPVMRQQLQKALAEIYASLEEK